MQEKSRVLILGHGEMGKAMEYLLKDRHPLTIWARHSSNNLKPIALKEAASQADIILFCLPVNPHQEIIHQIASHLKLDCLCISIAKGLDEAGQTAAQIFSKNLPANNPFALLYGPMISEEIRAGRNAFAQLGVSEKKYYHKVLELFQGAPLYIESTNDITGISWSVILKNVYALIFGMADELKMGDNMRGFLAAEALQELEKIVMKMGGQKGSPYHLAGLGDLITTATSVDSHHHELGCMLAREETENIKGEGIHTLQMVEQYQPFAIADYSLFYLIQTIVKHPQDVAKKINHYLQSIYS